MRNSTPLLVMAGFKLLSLFLVVGCQKSASPMMEEFRRQVKGISLTDSKSIMEAKRTCGEISESLFQSPLKIGTNVLVCLGRAFAQVSLDDRSYSSREKSLVEYNRLVLQMVNLFKGKAGYADCAWRFQLEALGKINLEMDRCRNEPPGGPYGEVSAVHGPFQTQRQYMDNLRAFRFKMVRTGFETGDFTQYFHSLPMSLQEEWIRRIEIVAGRKVVIWDPEKQLVELPVYKPDEDKGQGNGGNECERPRAEKLGGGREMRMIDVRGRYR